MSNRTIRVNELLRRELGDILRKHYQAEAVAMTVTVVVPVAGLDQVKTPRGEKNARDYSLRP